MKTAVIGLGGRGLVLLKGVILSFNDVEVVACCDVYADRAEKGAKAVKLRKRTTCEAMTDYKKVLEIEGLDSVIIATSWESHIEIATAAMEKGIYVGLEVGGAYSVDDCYKLIEVYERTKTPCMLLENCCYGEYELMVKSMVEKGLFGEVVHCSGSYAHDLRHEISFGKENRHYRLRNYLNRNCENYPTHELGPIAKILKINEGNRFVSLVSFSSNARGLHEYIVNKKADDKELINAEFKQGDIVTTILKCSNGETVTLTLDTTLPRYYSRGFTVRGTKAMYQEDGNVLFLDGKDNPFDFVPKLLWNTAKRRLRKYRDPIWRAFRKRGIRGGHGGMDYLVLREFFDAVKRRDGIVPIDVYDAAVWMAVTPLSEQSLNSGSVVEFPNFGK